MPKILTAKQAVEKLEDLYRGLLCKCLEINVQLEAISENIRGVCCPVCCDCHWDRAEEDL